MFLNFSFPFGQQLGQGNMRTNDVIPGTYAFSSNNDSDPRPYNNEDFQLHVSPL